MEIPLQVWIKGAKLKPASWKGLKEKSSIRESRRASVSKRSIDFEFFISHVDLKSNNTPIVALEFCICLYDSLCKLQHSLAECALQ